VAAPASARQRGASSSSNGTGIGDLDVDLGNLLGGVPVEQRLALLEGIGLGHGVGHRSSSS
jgi:hypothetical protein